MTTKKFGFYFLLFIIVVLAIKLYEITSSFLPAIATGCVLAYIFHPAYRYFRGVLHSGAAAAAVVIAIYITLILVPLTLIVISVQDQIQLYFTEDTMQEVQQALDHLEALLVKHTGLRLSDDLLSDQLPRLLSRSQNAITALGSMLITGLATFILSVFITIFLLFYLLIYSGRVVETLGRYFPLSDSNYGILLDEMGKDTRSLILGQLIIAALQGSLASLGFLVFGVPGVILWGMVMTLLSFIPMLGSGIIWFPAALILLFRGEYFNGIGLIVWGSVVVGLVDNFLRPKLTSILGKIHPVTVLIGVIAGIKEWGLIGMVLGPLLISVVLTLIKMFRKEYFDQGTVEST